MSDSDASLAMTPTTGAWGARESRSTRRWAELSPVWPTRATITIASTIASSGRTSLTSSGGGASTRT